MDSLQILLVEDNQVNQLMAQGTLAHLGHEVDVASDGQEALEAAKAKKFDLILMDLMMPVMDGYQSSQAILEHCERQALAPPVIIALTATLTEEEIKKCEAHGIKKWLSKPIDPNDFQELTNSLNPSFPTTKPAQSPEPPLQQAALMSRVRNSDSLAKIAELFRASFPERLKELRNSLNQERATLARRAAHTLKGNFLNFASPQGASLAERLERAIEKSQWKQAEEMLPELELECQRVDEALQQLLAEPSHLSSSEESTDGPGTGFKVIVADVDPANRAICAAALEADGYEVIEAGDGEQVLQLLSEHSVDVVLMGVFMANLGGFEACRRIKADEKTSMTPVLLVTAMDERGARLSGMDAGADDFITKPIDPREVSLRVRNAARGKELYDKLQTSFEELKRLEELRDGLTHMLVHDLRTPLTAIKGYASLLVAGFGAGLTPQQQTFAEKIVAQSNRLVEMVSAILDVSRLESDQMPLEKAKADLSLLLFEQSEQFSGLPDCDLKLEIADGVTLQCDAGLVGRVVANLMSNAFKYTPKGETVTLRLTTNSHLAKVEIIDKGPGVPPESREKIFEKFTQVEGETHKRPYSSGLGLTFCQLVVQKHGGEIAVDEAQGGGSRFWFTLPLV